MYDFRGEYAQRPDWVMCGMPMDSRVAIIASTELSRAELEAVRDRFDPIDPLDFLEPIRWNSMRYTLTVQMNGFVLVIADTYEEAFRSLFAQWTPKPAEHRQVGAGRREIGGA